MYSAPLSTLMMLIVLPRLNRASHTPPRFRKMLSGSFSFDDTAGTEITDADSYTVRSKASPGIVRSRIAVVLRRTISSSAVVTSPAWRL